MGAAHSAEELRVPIGVTATGDAMFDLKDEAGGGWGRTV
ncbi:hypothetical protein MAUB1S_11571 [Mycolicibacterium aubagnense]